LYLGRLHTWRRWLPAD